VKLVVGLGNPGRAYRWTRHNMGFWLIEQLAGKQAIDLSRRGWQSVYGRGRIGGEEMILAKPQTYMNLSGEAVSRLLRFFKIQPENLFVLHDDLDLPFGKIRIRLQGGHGGHQGIKSIMEALGNGDFVRLKVGIGRPLDRNQDPAAYVLQSLSTEEREEFKKVIQRGVQVAEILLTRGTQEAMNQYHRNGEE
jgi:PTH1 family peptidyl-tRNA hydrolase